ncbi:MAG: DNA gyrase inhibitor YacG [Acetobacteraceae bacterium]
METGGSEVTRCPICGRPTVTEFRPFCSRHCADVDLGRWFRGEYRIPASDAPEPEPDQLDRDEGMG